MKANSPKNLSGGIMQTNPDTTNCKQETSAAKIAWHEPQLRELDHLGTKAGTVFGVPEGDPTSLSIGFGNGLS